MSRRIFAICIVLGLLLLLPFAPGVSAQTGTPTPTSDPTLPDLIVTSIVWSPSKPQLGQSVSFTATIKNIGGVASPAGVIHDVLFHMVSGVSSQSLLSNTYTQSLAPGASATVPGNTTWTPMFGSNYTISAQVDSGALIVEGNESNNSLTSSTMILLQPTSLPPTWTATLTPTPNPNLPDLNVLSITEFAYSVPTATPNAQGCWQLGGGGLGLRVRIQNSGPTNAGSFILLLETNGTGYQMTVNSLAAGQILDVDYTSVPLGRTRVATVDYGNAVAESNETNNVLTVALPAATSTSTGTPRPLMCFTRTPTPTTGLTNTITRTPTRTLTPTTGPSLTPTSPTGGACSPVTSTITAPFTWDGAGVYCWKSSNLGSYINNWNNVSVALNGVNITNIYVPSGSYPAQIGGFWYVAYNSNVAWGHFEAK